MMRFFCLYSCKRLVSYIISKVLCLNPNGDDQDCCSVSMMRLSRGGSHSLSKCCQRPYIHSSKCWKCTLFFYFYFLFFCQPLFIHSSKCWKCRMFFFACFFFLPTTIQFEQLLKTLSSILVFTKILTVEETTSTELPLIVVCT